MINNYDMSFLFLKYIFLFENIIFVILHFLIKLNINFYVILKRNNTRNFTNM